MENLKPIPCEISGSYKQGRLSGWLTEKDISNALGFEPNSVGDEDKVTREWTFKYGVHECAIWDYKGARWSFYGPVDVFVNLGLGANLISEYPD